MEILIGVVETGTRFGLIRVRVIIGVRHEYNLYQKIEALTMQRERERD